MQPFRRCAPIAVPNGLAALLVPSLDERASLPQLGRRVPHETFGDRQGLIVLRRIEPVPADDDIPFCGKKI